MKRIAILLTIGATLAMLLTGCYMMSTRPTGSISFNLGGPSGRAISSTAKVRVYLYSYISSTSYSLYTFPDGKKYQEFQYGTGTQIISGVPAGLWQVLVSVGSDDPNGSEAFMTTDSGRSVVVSVTGGGSTSASFTTTPTQVVYSANLLGKNLNSVVYDYTYSVASDFPTLFVANTSTLYSIIPSGQSIDLATDVPTVVTGLPSGLQINSLSEAKGYDSTPSIQACVYINSNQGIIPYSYFFSGLLPTFSTALTDSSGNPLNILGANAVSDPTTQGLAIYYYRAGGVGGVDLTANNPQPSNGSTGATWVDFALSAPTSGNSVYAMAVDPFSAYPGFAYFATSSGAFRADPSMVTAPGTLGKTVSFSAPNNEPIQAIAVDGVDNVIYIGTPTGAYYATLNEASSISVISGSWTPIAATTGDNIVSIKVDQSAAYSSVGVEAVALRSTSTIYTFNGPPGAGAQEEVYPFYAGLPGELHSMDFADGVLYVVGSLGLAAIPVGEMPLA